MFRSPLFHRLPLALAIGCSLGSPSQAAETDPLLDLDSLVVTAAATGQSLKDAPASITVISAEDIERRPVLDLADLLGRIEGVTLQRSGNAVPGVQLRGFDQAYTAILIDGRRVNSLSNSFRGNDYDTGWVPAELIERIEVVRGPMSALYGSDAIGGVINIITKKADQQWRGHFDTTLISQEQRDAGDAWKTSAALSGPLASRLLARLHASADRREADGSVNGSTQDGLPRNKNNSAGAELTWLVNDDHDLSLNLDSSRRNHNDFTLRREAIALTHNGNYAFGSSQVSLQSDETRNLDGTVTGQNNPNRANTHIAQGRLTLPLDASTLSLGGEWKREKLKDPANLGSVIGSADTSVTTSAAFFEYELPLPGDLKLTLGNRLDHHENFGNHHSPRAYLVWHASPHVSLKGGWAKAFRAPTLLQNSPNWGSPSCGSLTDGCYIVGSTALDPETSTSKEIALLLDYQGWGGSLTLFRNDLRDMIDIDSRTADRTLAPSYSNFIGFLPDGRPMFAYQNLDKVRTQGVELAMHADLHPRLHGTVNYTYLDARNQSAGSPSQMLYKPRHSANATLDWDAATRLTVNATARYTGTQFTRVSTNASANVRKQAYTLTDLGLRYRVNPQLTLGGGLLNALDKKVERDQAADYNEERRRLYLSLALSF